MRFIKFFIFIFLNVPLAHVLDFNCPSSYCGINHYSISYPFKLQNQQPQVCSHYINLTCTSQNKTILNLPFSGDFHVVSVLYYARSIILRDPENCLAERLMNLNLSSSPFAAEYYQTFTFYNCPFDSLIYGNDFKVIDCLSIAPNATIATSDVSSAEMMKSYGCRKIVTKEIPVALFEGEYDIFSNLKLKWNVPSCIDCEEFDYQKQDESKNKMSKLISILILIPLAIIVAFLVVSYKRVANQRHRANARAAARTTTGEAALPRQTTTTAAVMQPQLVEDMIVPDGQYSYLKTMIFSTFLEENLGSLEGHDQGNCCTICLEEYNPQDIIWCLNSCHHYFHSKCIDQWFQDNRSCPVCRNPILGV